MTLPEKLEAALDEVLERHPRLDRVLEPVAHQLHNIMHEGFVHIGPVLVTSWRWHNEQMKNAFDYGVDIGRRGFVPPQPVPPSPRRRHLRTV